MDVGRTYPQASSIVLSGIQALDWKGRVVVGSSHDKLHSPVLDGVHWTLGVSVSQSARTGAR
jgi:hypothetical protein